MTPRTNARGPGAGVWLAICILISPTAAFAQNNAAAASKAAPAKASEAPIAVEIAPGSAYPEPQVRGIKGGSLWLTMQGWQWPYLPRVEGDATVRLAISGSAWVDTAYARIISGTPDTDKSLNRWTNQGRAVLRSTPSYSTDDGW